MNQQCSVKVHQLSIELQLTLNLPRFVHRDALGPALFGQENSNRVCFV